YFTEPAKAKAGYEKVFRDGSVTDYALEIRHRDGSVTPVLYNASVYRDTQGNVIGVFASARDITELKHAEKELRKAHDLLDRRVRERTSELVQTNTSLRVEIEERRKAESALRETSQYLENLINCANAPIIVWNPQFRITLFNHAFEYLTDRRAEEVIGKPLEILLPGNYQAEVMDLIRKTVAGERWESVEIPILQKTGKIRTVLWNSAPIYDFEGKNIVSIIAQGQDITERKGMECENRVRTKELAKTNAQLKEEIFQRVQAEILVKKTLSELQAAIESTADGIYAVDRTGRIIRYNQNFASMWKIPDDILESNENSRVSDYLRTQVKNPELFPSGYAEHLNHKERETYDMLELTDGRIFERYSKPQKMDSAIIGRVLSYRDVTDRRHAEEKLIASLQEKETLIREIHHRVKNNLQIISGLLDMTRMRTPDSTTSGILTDMMMKIKTMAQIHTRLYESKQFDRINMGSQIRDQVTDLSSIYGRSGTEIETVIETEDIFLPVDQAIPCALVVNEILSNAFKHAFKGAAYGTLNVSATRKDGIIHIRIRDDGVGIPKDVDVYKTTSLGLKLIRSLVTQLRGSVIITGNTGTEVIVEFPIHPEGV
ncbi:MAG: PAS domain S-box protein, partial [Methanoregulaceae archaeon]